MILRCILPVNQPHDDISRCTVRYMFGVGHTMGTKDTNIIYVIFKLSKMSENCHIFAKNILIHFIKKNI